MAVVRHGGGLWLGTMVVYVMKVLVVVVVDVLVVVVW